MVSLKHSDMAAVIVSSPPASEDSPVRRRPRANSMAADPRIELLAAEGLANIVVESTADLPAP